MEQEIQKKENFLINETYKERFQFIFSLDENIICQRYFRINGFIPNSIESVELKDTIDNIVKLIQKDLESKSRVYQWYTRDTPIKLTGFTKGDEETYFVYPSDIVDTYIDNDKPLPYEHCFKFSFLMDGKTVYEKIWDGGNYPKYVRNSVDLTNSNSLYKDREPMSLPFNISVVRSMTKDKNDLIYTIIREICDITSNSSNEKNIRYTKSVKYGNKKYRYSLYNEEFISGWREAVSNKTKEYFLNLFPSQKQIDKINSL